MENLIEKTVKVIKDFTGDEWKALVVIGRVAIIKNIEGKYVQMFCDRSEYKLGSDNLTEWSFGGENVSCYKTLQDACNGIHPKNVM